MIKQLYCHHVAIIDRHILVNSEVPFLPGCLEYLTLRHSIITLVYAQPLMLRSTLTCVGNGDHWGTESWLVELCDNCTLPVLGISRQVVC